MKVFVTVCTYEGCDDCGNGGSHVVGVFSAKERAEQEGIAHGKNKSAHYGHFHWGDVQEFEIDVLPKTLEDRMREMIVELRTREILAELKGGKI